MHVKKNETKKTLCNFVVFTQLFVLVPKAFKKPLNVGGGTIVSSVWCLLRHKSALMYNVEKLHAVSTGSEQLSSV